MTKIIIPNGTQVIIEGKPATTNGAWEVYADYGDQRERNRLAAKRHYGINTPQPICKWATECPYSGAAEKCLLPEDHGGTHVYYCYWECKAAHSRK